MYWLLDLDKKSKEITDKYFSIKIESMENKRDTITKMLNIVVVQQRNLRFNDGRLQQAWELANELINELKREYHIESN